jgi:hypothetical protein
VASRTAQKVLSFLQFMFVFGAEASDTIDNVKVQIGMHALWAEDLSLKTHESFQDRFDKVSVNRTGIVSRFVRVSREIGRPETFPKRSRNAHETFPKRLRNYFKKFPETAPKRVGNDWRVSDKMAPVRDRVHSKAKIQDKEGIPPDQQRLLRATTLFTNTAGPQSRRMIFRGSGRSVGGYALLGFSRAPGYPPTRPRLVGGYPGARENQRNSYPPTGRPEPRKIIRRLL